MPCAQRPGPPEIARTIPDVTTTEKATAPGTLRDAARDAVRRGLEAAIAGGALPALPDPDAAVVEVSRPANPEHGDLATNLALRLARPLRMAPPAIAAALVDAIAADPLNEGTIARAEAAGPGFVNLTFADAVLESAIDAVRRDPAGWGRVRAGAGPSRHVNVEFVSANPTGPLHVGNSRGAFVGDLLARVLEAGGQRVTREYYFNDTGAQVQNLGASILAIREGREIPRTATTASTSSSSRQSCRTSSPRSGPPATGTGIPRRPAPGRPGSGRRIGSGAASRRRSRPSGSASTSGRPRATCSRAAGSRRRSLGCGTAGTCTRRTARPGSGRRRSVTTRIGSSSARMAR